MTHNQLRKTAEKWETKRCPHCGKTKSLEEFYKNKRRPDGRHNWCKECAIAYQFEHRGKAREQIKEYQHEYYVKHRSEIEKVNNAWKEAHKEQYKSWKKEWSKEYNKSHLKKYLERRKERRKTDSIFLAKERARNSIRKGIREKGYTKKTKAYRLLGCDYATLWAHMLKTWEMRYGKPWKGEPYHMDHIIPLAVAKTEEEIAQLCHYTNIQMLTPEDNMEKGATYDA